MTDQTPDELFEPLEESEELLDSHEESAAGDGLDEEGLPQNKGCLFCGSTIDRRCKACPHCGQALGPFEPSTPKEYYRFFFCGLLLFLGALMPCCPDGPLAITTLFGGSVAIIGLAIMWNMWKAIYSGQVKLFWIMLTIIPLAIEGMRIGFAFSGDVADATSNAGVMAAHGLEGWGTLLDVFGSTPKWHILRNFFWVVGFSNVFFAIGCLLAWCFFIGGVFGGVKHGKVQAAQRTPRVRGRK